MLQWRESLHLDVSFKSDQIDIVVTIVEGLSVKFDKVALALTCLRGVDGLINQYELCMKCRKKNLKEKRLARCQDEAAVFEQISICVQSPILRLSSDSR